MFLGVLFGVLGCALWGLIYIVPLWLPDYSPATIAMGRFAVYGACSLVLCWHYRRELSALKVSDWLKAFCLGFFGNAVYYIFLTQGIRWAGVPTSGMLMALIPLNVALLTNRPGARTSVVVPWRRLWLPLLMILLGLWIGNIDEFSEISSQTSSKEYWLGFLCSFTAMALWTWFPIRNSQWLISHPKVSPVVWTCAQGGTIFPAAVLCFSAVNLDSWMNGASFFGQVGLPRQPRREVNSFAELFKIVTLNFLSWVFAIFQRSSPSIFYHVKVQTSAVAQEECLRIFNFVAV